MKKYIITQIDEFSYSIKINYNYKPIYACIKKILKNAIYDHETQSLLFGAENIKTLQIFLKEKKNLSHLKCIKMIHDLSQQINYLKKINYGIYGFDIDDIIVINDEIFLISSGNYLLSINDNSNFIFNNPIKIPYFGSPELITLTNLPGIINFNCIYYSLGALVIFCLLNEYLLVANEIKSEEEIDKILNPIHGTKIYWFLKRCIKTNCKKRVLLLI